MLIRQLEFSTFVCFLTNWGWHCNDEEYINVKPTYAATSTLCDSLSSTNHTVGTTHVASYLKNPVESNGAKHISSHVGSYLKDPVESNGAKCIASSLVDSEDPSSKNKDSITLEAKYIAKMTQVESYHKNLVDSVMAKYISNHDSEDSPDPNCHSADSPKPKHDSQVESYLQKSSPKPETYWGDVETYKESPWTLIKHKNWSIYNSLYFLFLKLKIF